MTYKLCVMHQVRWTVDSPAITHDPVSLGGEGPVVLILRRAEWAQDWVATTKLEVTSRSLAVTNYALPGGN